MPRIQNKRGLKTNQPTSAMLPGELFLHTDRGTAVFATGNTTTMPIVPAIEDLQSLTGGVAGTADFLIMHDASSTGVKEKKITFDDFKTALNIPAASTDEQVAVVSGGTSGYIWGTDGTDGILRMNSSMAMTKDAGDGFVTLAVGDVDCGTF